MENLGGSSLKVQTIGYSFVSRLKDFIRVWDDVDYSFNLNPAQYLIQFSGLPGATVDKLRNELDVVTDFQPDIIFLLVGTNDLFNHSAEATTQGIIDLTDTLHHVLNIKFVYMYIGHITYRLPSQQPSRYPVTLSNLMRK